MHFCFLTGNISALRINFQISTTTKICELFSYFHTVGNFFLKIKHKSSYEHQPLLPPTCSVWWHEKALLKENEESKIKSTWSCSLFISSHSVSLLFSFSQCILHLTLAKFFIACRCSCSNLFSSLCSLLRLHVCLLPLSSFHVIHVIKKERKKWGEKKGKRSRKHKRAQCLEFGWIRIPKPTHPNPHSEILKITELWYSYMNSHWALINLIKRHPHLLTILVHGLYL